jgi:hypothetical protein
MSAGAKVALVMLLLGSALASPARASFMFAPADADTLPTFEVKKNGWLAATETVGLNLLIWTYDRYIRESCTNPGFRIGFNSWEENFKNGYEWDDKNFATNQFAHPYHGSLYFNAARSNGFDYWGSLPFAFAGSFMWEYVMENHHPSYNDWIATSIGGAALGESLHRLSAMIVDNTATGSGRTWREIGGFLVNPMGGLNRIIHGDASKVQANPSDRFPSDFRSNFEVGLRTIGENRVWESDTTRVYLRASFDYGDPFAGDVEKPFDTFDFDIQLNFGDATGIGHARANGLLFAAPLSESESSQHLLGAYQHYEYVNNNAYEMGGQSLSGSYLSRIEINTATLLTQFHADGVIMGATKSDYGDFTGRSYSYGPGLGFRFATTLLRSGRPFFTLGHDSHWLFVVNGDDADHYLTYTYARLDLPIQNVFGVGVEYNLYHAERRYHDFPDVIQRSPEIKVFMNWLAY